MAIGFFVGAVIVAALLVAVVARQASRATARWSSDGDSAAFLIGGDGGHGDAGDCPAGDGGCSDGGGDGGGGD